MRTPFTFLAARRLKPSRKMNGYGHFAPAQIWAIPYWLSIASFLVVVSLALARLIVARRLAPTGILFLLLAVRSGGCYMYNAHVLNEYLNAKDRRIISVGQERTYKQHLPP